MKFGMKCIHMETSGNYQLVYLSVTLSGSYLL